LESSADIVSGNPGIERVRDDIKAIEKEDDSQLKVE